LLLVRGVELVGKIPPELQNYLVFEAGVGVAASEPEAAKALIKHLMSPEAVPVIKAKGWEPATRSGAALRGRRDFRHGSIAPF
jgi:molybdate transport system substrate-binding protein